MRQVLALFSKCGLVPLQRAMQLSAEQQKTLREECARGYAQSALLRQERTALLRQLDLHMVSDDGCSQDRITQVSAEGTRVVSSLPMLHCSLLPII